MALRISSAVFGDRPGGILKYFRHVEVLLEGDGITTAGLSDLLAFGAVDCPLGVRLLLVMRLFNVDTDFDGF